MFERKLSLKWQSRWGERAEKYSTEYRTSRLEVNNFLYKYKLFLVVLVNFYQKPKYSTEVLLT